MCELVNGQIELVPDRQVTHLAYLSHDVRKTTQNADWGLALKNADWGLALTQEGWPCD